MSIKVKVKIEQDFVVELPVDNYSDIWFENMPRKESDEMIADVISQQYNFRPYDIFVVDEVR